uniref:Chemokine interleukin-8-like domain-containing protein n=1 Tax=Cyprinus carpio TaxID=7962 RepID=A0A8C2JX01_CYPCA
MRSLMCLLFLVLSCSVQMTAQSKCCVVVTNLKIHLKLVTSYYWTSSNCPRRCSSCCPRQFIFCVDPEASWVNRYVAEMNSRSTICTVKTRLV